MRYRRLAASLLLIAPSTLAACGALWTYDDYTDQPTATAKDAGSGAGGGAGADGGSDAEGGPRRDAGRDAQVDAESDAEVDAESDAEADAAPALADPNVDGPYTYGEIDDKVKVSAKGDLVAVHCAYPTGGPSTGPFPVVVVAHAGGLPSSQYVGYVLRLATFGYVAITVEYPDLGAPISATDQARQARDVLAAIDWASVRPELAKLANVTVVGATGHALGGKLSFLAASLDPRVRAAITLDPVNSASSCGPPDCPSMPDLMAALSIPVAVLGETKDTVPGVFAACAPAANNFATFYASANSPALSVGVIGANQWSFLDDAACGPMGCSLCQAKGATLGNSVVNGLAKAFVVAFYERWLRGDTRYDDFLTGAVAWSRYVDPGLAVILSK